MIASREESDTRAQAKILGVAATTKIKVGKTLAKTNLKISGHCRIASSKTRN